MIRSTEKVDKTSTNLILLLLLLSLYYLAYRYPFQINSANTSPTYSDTPLILQIGKYLIYLIILWTYFITALGRGKNKLIWMKSKLLEAWAYLYLFIIPTSSFILLHNFYLIETSIFITLLLWIYIFKQGEIDVKKISKYFNVFIYLSIIVEVIQIFLMYYIDRLPALAYENSISIRFGSIWDDPNGFAIMISFLLPFSMYQKKWIVSLLLVVMLILTQSLTGIAGVLCCIPIAMMLIAIKNKSNETSKKTLNKLYLIIVFYFLLGLLFFNYIYRSSFFQNFMSIKQGSIDGHMSVFSHLFESDVMNYLGFSPQGLYGEAGYINLMLNYGVVYMAVYVLLIMLSIIRLVNIISQNKDRTENAVYYGALCFQIMYLIGLGNLPIDTMFPLNLLVMIFMAISIKEVSTDKKAVLNKLRMNKTLLEMR